MHITMKGIQDKCYHLISKDKDAMEPVIVNGIMCYECKVCELLNKYDSERDKALHYQIRLKVREVHKGISGNLILTPEELNFVKSNCSTGEKLEYLSYMIEL